LLILGASAAGGSYRASRSHAARVPDASVGSQDQHVGHACEVAVMRDQCGAAFVQGGCELNGVRELEPMLETESGCQDGDVCINLAQRPAEAGRGG